MVPVYLVKDTLGINDWVLLPVWLTVPLTGGQWRLMSNAGIRPSSVVPITTSWRHATILTPVRVEQHDD